MRGCETGAVVSPALLLSLWMQPKEVWREMLMGLEGIWGQTGMALSLGSSLIWEIKSRNDDFLAWSELWASARPFEWKRWLIRGDLWCKELPLSSQQGRGVGDRLKGRNLTDSGLGWVVLFLMSSCLHCLLFCFLSFHLPILLISPAIGCFVCTGCGSTEAGGK